MLWLHIKVDTYNKRNSHTKSLQSNIH